MKGWKKWALSVAVLCGILVLPVFAGQEKTGQEKTGQEKTGREKTTPEKTAQEEVEAALAKLQQTESMEATMTVDMELKLLWFQWNAQTTLDMVTFRDPMKIRADITMDPGLFGSSRLQAYARETEDGCQLFLNDGKHWKKQEVQADRLERYDGKKMMETYLEQLENLAWDGEEKLPGGMADRYTGVIHKEMEGVLWIDRETGYPVQYAMDVTGMVNEAVEKFLEADDEGKEEDGFWRKAMDGFWSKVELGRTQILIQCGAFNSAEDFQIPAEALEE